MTAEAIEFSPPTTVQKIVAETLGTFVLVFFGCGAALAALNTSQSGFFDAAAVAFAFGLSVLTMAYAVGHISGGHFNPAVSLGHAVSGRMSWSEAGLYSGVQVLGATLAAFVLWGLTKVYGLDAGMEAVSNTFDRGRDLDWFGALVLEIIATAIFVTVILAVTDKRRGSEGIPAPVAIGLTLTMIHLMLIAFTGCSVNPARSIGPALFGGGDALKPLILFIVAPLIGAAIAGLLYPIVFGRDRERPVRAPKAAPVAPPQGAWGADPNAAWGAQQPQQQWGQPAAPQQPAPGGWQADQGGWGQPSDSGAQPWAAPEEEGRTQIRPSDQG